MPKHLFKTFGWSVQLRLHLFDVQLLWLPWVERGQKFLKFFFDRLWRLNINSFDRVSWQSHWWSELSFDSECYTPSHLEVFLLLRLWLKISSAHRLRIQNRFRLFFKLDFWSPQFNIWKRLLFYFKTVVKIRMRFNHLWLFLDRWDADLVDRNRGYAFWLAVGLDFLYLSPAHFMFLHIFKLACLRKDWDRLRVEPSIQWVIISCIHVGAENTFFQAA